MLQEGRQWLLVLVGGSEASAHDCFDLVIGDRWIHNLICGRAEIDHINNLFHLLGAVLAGTIVGGTDASSARCNQVIFHVFVGLGLHFILLYCSLIRESISDYVTHDTVGSTRYIAAQGDRSWPTSRTHIVIYHCLSLII